MDACLEQITIDKIDFGEIEGKIEFDISDPDKVNYTFVPLNNKNLTELFSKEKYFIHGNKGTGKTSLIRYLHLQLKSERNTEVLLILFKDAKEDPKIYSQIKKLMNEMSDEDLDMAALTFWRWFILSLIAKNMLDYKDKYSIFYKKEDSALYRLANYMKDLINFATPIASIPAQGIEFTIKGFDGGEVANDDIFEYSGVCIDYLEKVINRNLRKKVYVLFDELDITVNDSKRNKILVKNIIPATQYLNKLTNVFIIASIRSEVLNAVFNGNEINKLMEMHGVYMDWTDERYNISHPLMQIMLKKIRYSFIVNCPSCKNNIEKMSDSEIFKRLFPNSILRSSDKDFNNEQYILNTTWNKPRDIVRLFKIMQTKADKAREFSSKHFADAMDVYSERAWGELSEEMTASLNDDEIKMVQDIFNNYQNCFNLDVFTTRARQIKSDIDESWAKEFLKKLFEIGFLVNHGIDKNGKQLYKCSFRKSKTIDFTMPIEVHRGLWETFRLNDSRAEVLSNWNNENETFSSLGDRLRQR